MGRIFVRLAGGLGNQIFQVVASYRLAIAKNVDLSNIIIDARFLGNYDSPHNLEVEFISRFLFPINLEIHRHSLAGLVCKFRLGKLVDRRVGPIELISSASRLMSIIASHRKAASYILDGYFQHPDLLFSGQERSRIRELLLSDKGSFVESLKGESGAIGVHIRRGDYVTSKAASRVFRTVPFSFYHSALERLPKGNLILVFSDDLSVSKSFATSVGGVDISSMKLSLQEEFCALAACENHVISNSTFSWWAAYLGNRSIGRVISPRNWYYDTERNKNNPLILSHFELIDN